MTGGQSLHSFGNTRNSPAARGIDGYLLAKKGQAGKALGMSIILGFRWEFQFIGSESVAPQIASLL
jgi:TctA family transporter